MALIVLVLTPRTWGKEELMGTLGNVILQMLFTMVGLVQAGYAKAATEVTYSMEKEAAPERMNG